jgi:hypothetical protein
VKPLGHTWSYLACRVGRLVPIWQPLTGYSFRLWDGPTAALAASLRRRRFAASCCSMRGAHADWWMLALRQFCERFADLPQPALCVSPGRLGPEAAWALGAYGRNFPVFELSVVACIAVLLGSASESCVCFPFGGGCHYEMGLESKKCFSCLGNE